MPNHELTVASQSAQIKTAITTTKQSNFTKKIPLNIVTSNEGKVREIQSIIGDVSEITVHRLDLPEFQGSDVAEIAKQKCRMAVEAIRKPVIIDDTSLGFTALGGLPGPYIKWFLPLGAERLYKLLAGFDDKSAVAVCTVAYGTPYNDEIQLFTGSASGRIVPPRGQHSSVWFSCFEPDGFSETYAELRDAEFNLISHRALALRSFRETLMSDKMIFM